MTNPRINSTNINNTCGNDGKISYNSTLLTKSDAQVMRKCRAQKSKIVAAADKNNWLEQTFFKPTTWFDLAQTFYRSIVIFCSQIKHEKMSKTKKHHETLCHPAHHDGIGGAGVSSSAFRLSVSFTMFFCSFSRRSWNEVIIIIIIYKKKTLCMSDVNININCRRPSWHRHNFSLQVQQQTRHSLFDHKWMKKYARIRASICVTNFNQA